VNISLSPRGDRAHVAGLFTGEVRFGSRADMRNPTVDHKAFVVGLSL
jgi:hypothetical protein